MHMIRKSWKLLEKPGGIIQGPEWKYPGDN